MSRELPVLPAPTQGRPFLTAERTGRLSKSPRLVVFFAVSALAAATAACSSGSAVANPTSPTAYVANGANVANPGNTVAVVDTSTSTALAPITTGTLPSALAVTPDGKDLLVANKGVDQLTEVDVASGTVVKKITVGLEPDAVAVTPDGKLALVANFGDNTVTPVSLPSLQAGRPIPVGRQPVAIAVAPNGSTALVAELPGRERESHLAPRPDPSSPDRRRGRPDLTLRHVGNTLALVANFQSNTVTPLDLATMGPGPPIAIGTNPTGIAGLPSSSTVWVSGGDSVTPIDVTTQQSGPPIPIGTTAEAIALMPGGTSAWVCGGNGNLVHVDLKSRTVVGQVAVGNQPSAVAIAQGQSG